ncbi:MAG: phosphotransferase family protein [Gammaproteobacteria bacterium]
MAAAAESFDEETQDVIERLRACVRRRFGTATAIERIDVATLGGSNRTLLFDLLRGTYPPRQVLRQETVPPDYTPFLAPRDQYAVLAAAYAHGVPAPEPIFPLEAADELGEGYITGAIAGETLPKRLLTDPRYATARLRYLGQAGAMLARLHAIDLAEVGVLTDVPESDDVLTAWRAHYERWEEPHPTIEYAFRWLERERPPAARRVLLHGDFRNGNMIVGEEGIRALLDWECAHLGDPLEDFGWFCTRSWRFGFVDRPAGGFGQREEFYRAYEAASGAALDRAAARWWEIFGLVRWALYNLMQLYGHRTGRRRSPAFAACGRNTCLIEYDLLMTLAGKFD